MKKTVQVLVWLLAATLAATAVAAQRRDSGRKKSGANDAVSEKIAEWVREVKKQEAAPVAEGFVRWTGLDSIKGTKNARWLSPSDLRGRFVVVVDIDAAKAPEQVKATIGIQNLALNPNGHGTDWDFAPVPRDIVVVYNVHDLSDEDIEKKLYENDAVKKEVIAHAFNFYGFVTFEGAPDCQGERPYVYVMGPEGTEALYKGKYVANKTAKEVKDAIAKAAAELPAWRPWYGYVTEVKHTKGFDAAIAGGKGLAPFTMTLKKGIVSKKPEVAAESQRLYDALEQRKGDLLYAIKAERAASPCAMLYDIEEVSRRFPTLKRDLAECSEKVQKQHPNITQVYKHYALFRRCADPAFKAKSASEAKKLAAELEKARPILTKMGDDPKDVAIQNMALSLVQRMDDVVAELPAKVQEK